MNLNRTGGGTPIGVCALLALDLPLLPGVRQRLKAAVESG